MARTVMSAVVSLDGYIADDDDGVGPLFDWFGNGDVEWTLGDTARPFRSTQASVDFMRELSGRSACEVIGRRLFDLTNGWNGVPADGEHVFVVTHQVPTGWEYLDSAPFSFVTEGVATAIERAREFAGPDRDVSVMPGEIGGQALRLGLVDQVVMNVVPVVFGSGRPFFGAMGPGEKVLLGDPSRTVPGKRVTHVVYDVPRP
jgi:dihydrofolate reductase